MTRNRAIDVLRRDVVRLNVQRRIWAEMTSLPKTIDRNPETAVDLHMRKERIQIAIKQLSEEQRDVLALAYFQGYTQSEIAQLRNLPLGTVKTRIRSGIQKLRQLLREDQFN
jgi:RNA polymerase sigma-70 factor (ECF subfamily)